jgi:hypothetical protein
MPDQDRYPTAEHARAADAIVSYFSTSPGVETILLTNSCARGTATRDSCLDIAILAPADAPGREALAPAWARFQAADPCVAALRAVGRFSVVHLDVIDGAFRPDPRDLDSGADWFEVELGNYLVYARPLWQPGDHYAHLRARWLPYYGDDLRAERLAAVRSSCLHHLDHIPPYVERGLFFQSFDRLYIAFALFLQGLFIARRTYPIAYNKWIRQQIIDILGMPDLYPELPRLFEIERFESTELVAKARALRALLEAHVTE